MLIWHLQRISITQTFAPPDRWTPTFEQHRELFAGNDLQSRSEDGGCLLNKDVSKASISKNKPETWFKFTVENITSPKTWVDCLWLLFLDLLKGVSPELAPKKKNKQTSHPPHLTSPFPTCQVVFCGDSGDNFPKSHRNQRMAVDSGPCWQREIHGKKSCDFLKILGQGNNFVSAWFGCYRLEFKPRNIFNEKESSGRWHLSFYFLDSMEQLSDFS